MWNILIGGATKLVHCRAVRTGSLMILRLEVDNPRVRQYILGDENARTSVCEKSRTPPVIVVVGKSRNIWCANYNTWIVSAVGNAAAS